MYFQNFLFLILSSFKTFHILKNCLFSKLYSFKTFHFQKFLFAILQYFSNEELNFLNPRIKLIKLWKSFNLSWVREKKIPDLLKGNHGGKWREKCVVIRQL